MLFVDLTPCIGITPAHKTLHYLPGGCRGVKCVNSQHLDYTNSLTLAC